MDELETVIGELETVLIITGCIFTLIGALVLQWFHKLGFKLAKVEKSEITMSNRPRYLPVVFTYGSATIRGDRWRTKVVNFKVSYSCKIFGQSFSHNIFVCGINNDFVQTGFVFCILFI